MKVVLSARLPVDAFTEPESLGQPEPENFSDVICGEDGGAAMTKAGAMAARRYVERMVVGLYVVRILC